MGRDATTTAGSTPDPVPSPDHRWTGALELAAAIRRREVGPVEVVEAALARLGALNDAVGAFVTVDADRARDQAKEAERLLADRTAQLPPLLGVPTAVKDLTLTAGVPTGLGSRAYRDFVPPLDDHVVTLMRRAGMISLGKTAVPEFGLPCYTVSDVAPPARTPWDLSRSAGGSSGGAAAAVAAGIVPVAQGSDGGGSVRIPASVCGLVGIKPSRGRVSNGPLIGDLGTGLVWNGPLARSVADAAALLDVLAVPMPGDPYLAPAPSTTFLASTHLDVGRLRIGWTTRSPLVEEPVAPACAAAVEDACVALGHLGHEVVPLDLPLDPALMASFAAVWAAGAAAAPVAPDQEDQLRPLTRWLREQGRAVSGAQLLGALGALQFATRVVLGAMESEGVDVLLMPTLAMTPRPVGWFGELADAAEANPADDFGRQVRFTPFTSLFNVTGQPAVSLPTFWTEESLPIGIMLAGRYGAEQTLIGLSARLEEVRPWAHRRPRL